LNYFRRFNVRYLSAKAPGAGYPHDLGPIDRNGPSFLAADGDWDLNQLETMQDSCRRADMVLEGVRMDSAYIVMQEGPERERYLDIIRENLRKASKAGIQLVSYHWTMIPIRRNRTVPGRGGSSYTGLKLEDHYQDLPATAAAGRVSLEDYWSRIDHFLRNVVPVARECRVRLACHPYDPGGLPLGYQGVDNYDAVDFVAAVKRYELLYDDIYNGFTYDCGVGAESMDDPNAQLGLLRYLAERGKIAQVHFRNIRGHRDDFIETYIDEGDVNMLDIVRVLRDTNWEGSLLPDHVPNPHDPDDPHKLQSFAFAFGYIQGMLRAAGEEAIRAIKS
jgi:mannonate dehydratase